MKKLLNYFSILLLSGAYTFTLNATVDIPIDPIFVLTDNYCQGETTDILPSISDNGIVGTWDPAVIDNNTSGTYIFTPDAGQSASIYTLNVTIDIPVVPTFTQIAPPCENDPIINFPTASNNGAMGTWEPTSINPAADGPSVTATFTPSGGCFTTATMTVVIDQTVTPTFTQVGPLCENDAVFIFPNISNNGATGTWVPASINPATDGPGVQAIFTPSDWCFNTVSQSVVIHPAVTPTFPQIGPLCENDAIIILPTTSNNGATGTWNPASINPATDGPGVTATFTPSGGCFATATMTVVIDQTVTPTFPQVGPLCETDQIVFLPTSSMNGATGTWTPSSINPATDGPSVTAIFTPSDGCFNSAVLFVAINPVVAPVFDPVGPLCETDPVFILPTSSNNGATGTWIPASINPFTDGPGVTAIFTPSSSCFYTTTIGVVIVPAVDCPQTCVDHLIVNGTYGGTEVFQAINSVTSDATMINGAIINMYALDVINLNVGFSIDIGAEVLITIDDCQ